MLLRIRLCGSQFHIRVYEKLNPCHRATLAWVMWRWCVYVMLQQGNSVAAVGIERVPLTDDAHIDDAVDAECQSTDGEQHTDYAQRRRVRYVWPGPS